MDTNVEASVAELSGTQSCLAESLKFKLLKMRMQDELSREEFEQANANFEAEIDEIEEQMQVVALRREIAASFVRFAELQLADIAKYMAHCRARAEAAGSKFVI